jgi:four helix bundle protein
VATIDRFGFKRLDVYQAAVEHFGWVAEVVARMERVPFKVTGQLTGASLSILSNIGEANGREGRPGEAEQHYRYALGSTFEAAAHLDALAAMGVIADEEYVDREARLGDLAAMLSGMIRRHKRRGQS